MKVRDFVKKVNFHSSKLPVCVEELGNPDSIKEVTLFDAKEPRDFGSVMDRTIAHIEIDTYRVIAVYK